MATLAMACFAQLAHADTINVTGTVDISGGYDRFVDLFGPITPSPVSIKVGDTVNVSYSFTGGLLRLADTPNGSGSTATITGWLAVAIGGASGSFTMSSYTIDLLGASSQSGLVPTSFAGGPQSSGSAHLGPFDGVALADGDYVQFSGISASFVVSALPASPNSYDRIRTRFFADETPVVPGAAPIPEPGTFALLGMAAAGAYLIRRSRKKS